MKPWNSSFSDIGPARYIEMPLIRLLKYCGRTLSGMSAYAKNDTSEVNSKRIDEDHQTGLHQVAVLGIFELAVDLRERFLARHREKRMAERHQNSNQSKQCARILDKTVMRRVGHARLLVQLR